jgi:hypothetical protein
MNLIGYVLAFLGILNLLFNIRSYLALSRVKKMTDAEGKSDPQEIHKVLAPQMEYHGGLIILSSGALLTGIYIAVVGATLLQLLGFVVILLGLSSVTQSFRRLENQDFLVQTGDGQFSVRKLGWRLRLIGVILFAVGSYLIT